MRNSVLALLLAIGCATHHGEPADAPQDSAGDASATMGTCPVSPDPAACQLDGGGTGTCVRGYCYVTCADSHGGCPAGLKPRQGALPQPPYLYCYCD